MRRMWLAVVLILAACADEIPEDVSQEMEAARAASEAEDDTAATQPDLETLLRTAPPGGHADWIRDIRLGLDSVPVEAAADRGAALYRVQELYTRRFEAVRAFLGPDGVMNPGAAVSDAVERASSQMQELMRQLAANAPSTAIEQSVQAAHAALGQVEAATRAAGISPAAPRDAVPTTTD